MASVHSAAKRGDIDLVEHLLKTTANIDVNSVDGNGNSILHLVARFGHLDMLQILFMMNSKKYPFNPFQKNMEGRKPVELAMHYQHHECAELLLRFKYVGSTKVEESAYDEATVQELQETLANIHTDEAIAVMRVKGSISTPILPDTEPHALPALSKTEPLALGRPGSMDNLNSSLVLSHKAKWDAEQQQMMSELEKAGSQLVVYEQEVAEKNKLMAAMEQEFSALQLKYTELTPMKERVLELEVANERLKTQLAEERGRNSVETSKLEVLDELRGSLQAKLHALEADLSEERLRHQQTTTVKASLEAQQREQQVSAAKAEAENTTMRARLEQLQEQRQLEAARHAAQIQAKDMENAGLTATCQHLEAAKQTAEKNAMQVSSAKDLEMVQLRAQLQAAEKQNATISAEVQLLQTKFDLNSEDCERIRDQSRGEQQSLQQMLAEAKEEAMELKQTAAARGRKVEGLTSELETANVKLQARDEEIERMRLLVGHGREEKNKLEEAVAQQKEREAAAHLQEVARLQSELAEKAAEYEDLKNSNASLNKKIIELTRGATQDVEQADREYEELVKARLVVVEKFEQLQETSSKQINELSVRLQAATDNAHTWEMTLIKEQEKLSTEKEKRAAVEAQLEKLLPEVEELRPLPAQLRTVLEQCQEQKDRLKELDERLQANLTSKDRVAMLEEEAIKYKKLHQEDGEKYQAEILKLEEALVNIQTQLQDWQNKYYAEVAGNAVIKQEHDLTKSDLAAKTSALEESEMEVAKLRSEGEAVAAKLKEVQFTLDTDTVFHENLAKEHRDGLLVVERAQKELGEKAAELAKTKDEVTEKEAEITQLKESIEVKEQQSKEAIEAEERTMDQLRAEMEAERKEAAMAKENLEKEVAELKAQLKAELTELKQKLAQETEEKTIKQQLADGTQACLQAAEQLIEEQKAKSALEKSALEKELEGSQAALAEALQEAATITSAKEQAKAACTRVIAERDGVIAERDDLTAKLEENMKELESAAEMLLKFQTKLEEKKTALAGEQEKLDTTTKEAELKGEEIQRVTHALKVSTEEHRVALEALAEKEAEVQSMQGQMDMAKEVFKKIQQEKQWLQEAKEMEEQGNKRLIRSLDQYKRELNRLGAQLKNEAPPSEAKADAAGVPAFLL
uniref:Uncharacterized protein n=1 Tax=Pyramimonas obovata TaxID=1411642 RepID=A0A7S0RMH5_9CHLO|mmetsp:Transcript_38230/g.83159  ORF Transcript_38230/g.83159 Transcript_38230/m.83159 type:complete len:1148 (+) Transcript_38230:198-3641(+)